MAKAKIQTAAAEARRAYQREWNSRNKERLRQYRKNYWEKKAAALADEIAAAKAVISHD